MRSLFSWVLLIAGLAAAAGCGVVAGNDRDSAESAHDDDEDFGSPAQGPGHNGAPQADTPYQGPVQQPSGPGQSPQPDHSGQQSPDQHPGDPGQDQRQQPHPIPCTGDFCPALTELCPWNVLVRHDFTGVASDVEGSLAAGGNISLRHYSVGDLLPPDPLRSDVVALGDFTFDSGNITNGGIAVAGCIDRSESGTVFGITRRDPPDLLGTWAAVAQASAQLAAIAPGGVTSIEDWGQARAEISLTGADPALNVFSLDACELARAHTFRLTVPAGSLVVVNVSGHCAAMDGFGMFLNGVSHHDVIFNFVDARDLRLGSISLEGTVLAPHARVMFDSGVLQGHLVARRFSGGGQINWRPLSVCRQHPPGQTPGQSQHRQQGPRQAP